MFTRTFSPLVDVAHPYLLAIAVLVGSVLLAPVLALAPAGSSVHHKREWTAAVVHSHKDVVKTFMPSASLRHGTNTRTKLSHREAYMLEVSVLERLNAVPSPCGEAHVPKLLRRDDATLTLTQSWDGVPLKEEAGRTGFCKLPPESVERQAHCIDEHLRLANVTHDDNYWESGKNTLLDGTRLVLVDYDMATLDRKPSSIWDRYHKVSPHTGKPTNVHHKHLLVMLEQFRRANCGSSVLAHGRVCDLPNYTAPDHAALKRLCNSTLVPRTRSPPQPPPPPPPPITTTHT